MSRGFFKINIITFSGKDRNNNEVISRLEIVQGGQMIIFWLANTTEVVKEMIADTMVAASNTNKFDLWLIIQLFSLGYLWTNHYICFNRYAPQRVLMKLYSTQHAKMKRGLKLFM